MSLSLAARLVRSSLRVSVTAKYSRSVSFVPKLGGICRPPVALRPSALKWTAASSPSQRRPFSVHSVLRNQNNQLDGNQASKSESQLSAADSSSHSGDDSGRASEQTQTAVTAAKPNGQRSGENGDNSSSDNSGSGGSSDLSVDEKRSRLRRRLIALAAVLGGAVLIVTKMIEEAVAGTPEFNRALTEGKRLSEEAEEAESPQRAFALLKEAEQYLQDAVKYGREMVDDAAKSGKPAPPPLTEEEKAKNPLADQLRPGINNEREQRALVFAAAQLAHVYYMQKKFPDAEREHLRVVKILTGLYGQNAACLIEPCRALGWLYLMMGRLDDAEGVMKRCYEIAHDVLLLRERVEKQQNSTPSFSGYLTFVNKLVHQVSGVDLHDFYRSKLKDMVDSDEDRLSGVYDLEDKDPLRADLSAILEDLATITREGEKFEDSLAWGKRALQLTEGLLGPGHPQVVTITTNLCHDAALAGKLEEAKRYGERAVQAFAVDRDVLGSLFDDKQQTALGPFGASPSYALNELRAVTLYNLGDVYSQLGDKKKALSCLHRAQALANECAVAGMDTKELLSEIVSAIHRTNSSKVVRALKRNPIFGSKYE